MMRKLFLIVSILLVSLISYGQHKDKKLKTKVSKENRAKMTPEQRLVNANQDKMKRKKKNMSVGDRVRSETKESRKARRIRRPSN